MKNVIPFHYQGQKVQFSLDGWINATEAAKRYGKRPVDWLKQDETKSYLSALAQALNCDPESLLKTQRGRYNSGTWLHPKLAVAFARWLDMKFSVWCDLHIDALLRGELNEKQQFERACQEYDEAFLRASRGAKEMARFRWRKPLLVEQVEHWRHQLQLTLGLDDQAA
ncbi:DNA-binding protein [Pseudomonas otitidis]|uniref:DNA-binding protein n=1 Tax=Metapseudomonas otitidis TaxID=319939 RepID=A0A7X3H5M9_9GAMM|nr:KilA-N domain-containing protein [Pseudomonas otitidis]MWK55794.1 DNA-binding protein [Pseudomonas otitidis]